MFKKLSSAEKTLLSIWIIVNLLIGILIVQDFGISFDEPRYFQYASQSVDAFKSWFAQSYEPDYGPANLRFYGPSYILVVELLLRGLGLFTSHISAINIWHFSYFLLFQLTGLCLYSLSRRWLDIWSAWLVMVLFVTQPLLWGHAFMNPKDTPFMAFVMFCVYLGFKMADSLPGSVPQVSLQKPLGQFSEAWRQISVTDRKKVFKLVTAGVSILLSTVLLNYVIAKVVIFFYSAEAISTAGKLFEYFADRSSAAPVNNYIALAQTILNRLIFSILGLALLGTILWAIYLLSKTNVYRELKLQWKMRLATKENVKSGASNLIWRDLVDQALRALGSVKIILAGIVLGLTVSIRILGPLPGFLISIYLLWKNRQQALPALFAYAFWASLTTYITWPFLWVSPLSRYLESLVLMINFPWSGRVLFNGHFYQPDRLPNEYLPVLLNIQFTEPLLILFYLGFLASLRKLLLGKVSADILLFIGLGFALPLVGFVALRTPLYDNFRQLLFIVPPIFVVAGHGFEIIIKNLKSNYLRASLLILCALPGIYSIINLHPYEYVYYNSLVGGVGGAARQYELDYWRTAYRELAIQVNERASTNANIFVTGVPFSYLPYSRSDITVEYKTDPNNTYDFEYAVLTSRWNSDERSFPDAEVVYTVERDEAVLAVLKYVKK